MSRELLPLTLAALPALLVAACTGEPLGDPHPVDELDFPVAVTADPSGRIVWVTSGNFDLAHRGGAVLAVDVATHEYVTAEGPDGEDLPVAFQVGGFPGPLQLLERDGRAISGYVLSREDDALYHVSMTGDETAPRLSCSGGRRSSETNILVCPPREDLAEATVPTDDGEDRRNIRVGPDPYGALVHHARPGQDRDVLLTGAMVDGTVATFGLAEDGAPELLDTVDLQGGLFAFAESPVTGRIYTTHKTQNIFNVLEIHPPDPEEEVASPHPRVERVGSVTIPASIVQDHARGMAISADGARLYAAYRSPSSLLVVDIAREASATPSERILAKIPIGRRPADVVVVPPSGDLPELVYVSSQRDDRIEVVDPALGEVVDTVLVGDDPFGMAFVDNPELGIRRLYVTNFQSESLGVVELDPTSPYFHTQIAEIR
ncbi:MAG: hypothetical protein ACQEXJ_23205 [Myxococcota bacterium]